MLNRFPKSKDIIMQSPPANVFYTMLQRGVDPFTVMDEMIFFYESREKEWENQIELLIKKHGYHGKHV